MIPKAQVTAAEWHWLELAEANSRQLGVATVAAMHMATIQSLTVTLREKLFTEIKTGLNGIWAF